MQQRLGRIPGRGTDQGCAEGQHRVNVVCKVPRAPNKLLLGFAPVRVGTMRVPVNIEKAGPQRSLFLRLGGGGGKQLFVPEPLHHWFPGLGILWVLWGCSGGVLWVFCGCLWVL